jgi:hypothetical protein
MTACFHYDIASKMPHSSLRNLDRTWVRKGLALSASRQSIQQLFRNAAPLAGFSISCFKIEANAPESFERSGTTGSADPTAIASIRGEQLLCSHICRDERTKMLRSGCQKSFRQSTVQIIGDGERLTVLERLPLTDIRKWSMEMIVQRHGASSCLEST